MAFNGLGTPWIKASPSPLVRLHGCTDKGMSVVCLLQGLYPYVSPPIWPRIDRPQLYFPVSASFNEKVDTPRLLAAIKQNAKTEIQIHTTEIVTREPLMYYRPNKDKYNRFIKIYCQNTGHQNALARVLESSDQSPGLEDMMKEGKLYDLTVMSRPH
jgi:hypothetical protein